MKQFNLAEYLKNPSRKVVTRDGKSVRIRCTDRIDPYFPIVALISTESGEDIVAYTSNGLHWLGAKTDYDLFFAPEKHEGWVNIYKAEVPRKTLGCLVTRYVGSSIWPTEEAAKTAADTDDIVTIKIEWEE